MPRRFLAQVAGLTLTAAVLVAPGVARSAAGQRVAYPMAETDPVAAAGDAADDPAIWVHPTDPAASLVLGTDKATDHLEVYDLNGRRLQRLADRNALLNNVDVQGNFQLGDRAVGLVATSGSDIGFYAIDPATRHLTDVTPATPVRGASGAAGVCLYTSPRSGKTYAFSASGNGNVQQFEITAGPDGKVRAVSVRGPWDVNPAPDYEPHDGEMEACAVDDETGTLYVAEQAIGVWAYGAEPTDPTGPASRTLVTSTSTYNGGPGTADLEGIAVVGGPDGTGWVIVSSQGSSSYIVAERAAPHAYVATVVVSPAGQVDGCSWTDGIDAVGADLGGYYQRGLFVCQDDRNVLASGQETNQNFKLVPLEHVLPLPPPDGPVPPTTTTTSTSSTTTSSTTTSTTTTSTTSSTTTSTTTTTSGPSTTTTASPTTTAPPPAGDDPLTVPSGQGPTPHSRPLAGYWMLGSRGETYAFGDAGHRGNTGPLPPSVSAVDLEPTPSGAGYWILTNDGNVRAFGDARWLGNVAPTRLSPGERVASLSATPAGTGYWVFTDRGRAMAFGHAKFLGDVSALTLNGPVLDSVATPTGQGYYMVASDGGIFSFGDARFYGSTGDRKLNAPVQSLVPTADGKGYWLVASDGGIFAFSAPFRGSMGGTKLNKPVTGMVRYGDGYLMVAADGGIFNFSDQPFAGSLGATPSANPIVSVAALTPSL